MSDSLTACNRDDRKPVPILCTTLFRQRSGDNGYIGKWLRDKRDFGGLELIPKLRQNIRPVVQSAFDQAILERRSLVETVTDELKKLCLIARSRLRSVAPFMVNSRAASSLTA